LDCKTIEFLKYQSSQWKKCMDVQGDLKEREMTEGLNAYAAKQSALQMDLCKHFQQLWTAPLLEWKNTDDNNNGNDADANKEGMDNVTHKSIWDAIQGEDGEDSDSKITIDK